jgi:hypothetical protein
LGQDEFCPAESEPQRNRDTEKTKAEKTRREFAKEARKAGKEEEAGHLSFLASWVP